MANKTIVAMKKQHDKEMMSVMLGCVDSAAVGGREGEEVGREVGGRISTRTTLQIIQSSDALLYKSCLCYKNRVRLFDADKYRGYESLAWSEKM